MRYRRCVLVLAVMCTAASASQDPPVRKSTIGVYAPQGTVTELTKEFITVHPPGQAAKRFVLSETLAAGKTPNEPRPRPRGPYNVSPSYKYRVTDVNIGDEITVIYTPRGEE